MPQPQFDIIGFGAVNVDYIVAGPTDVGYFDDLERGEEHHEEDFELLSHSIENLRHANRELRVQIGGSALNTMRGLAGLATDLRLGFVSVAGGSPDDLPSEASLGSLPPSVELMIEWQGGPHGACVSVVQDGARTLMTYNNAQASRSLRDPDRRDRIAAQLAQARVVHVTSIFGEGAPHAVAELMHEVRRRRPDVAFGVDLGHVWARSRASREVLALADIVFLNEAELSLLTPTPSNTWPTQSEQERAGWILDRLSAGATRVIVLKKRDNAGRGDDYIGRAGAVMYSRRAPGGEVRRHEVIHEALGPSKIIDSTGAGDVFAAGALAALYSPKIEAEQVLGLGFAAAAHKMQRPGIEGYKNLDLVASRDWLPAGQGKVFISHASADAALVRALECLLHAGSPLECDEQFFCSSNALEGPQPFEHLRRTIWAALRAAEYVVFVVTPAFMRSRECTYELGAAAALGIPSIALLAPQMTFEDHVLPVGERAGGHLNERSALAKVWSCLRDTYGYAHVDPRKFEDLQQAVVDEANRLVSTPDLLSKFPPGQSGRKVRKKSKSAARKTRQD
ncbi:MAG: hypothetical protein QOJ63_1794 [Solirubrobacteraceae bacterium]|jgi:sugar/nucleoside kinase (ribokinase family)|nr:hypothetical protein [Solirubrobacteraceae bacterium]